MSDSSNKMPPSWRAMNADTDPWAEQIQFKFFREAPSWRKLELAGELTRGMLMIAQSGFESRHPEATPQEIRRMMAGLILGEELAFKVYGPPPLIRCATEVKNVDS